MIPEFYDIGERLRLLSTLGQIGWCEVDFTAGEVFCSEYTCSLFGLDTDSISFIDFKQLIRFDYRERVYRMFLAAECLNFFEQIFPVVTLKETIWVSFRIGNDRKYSQSGHQIAFGVLQRVEPPEGVAEANVVKRTDNLLYYLGSISHSLHHFLKEEEVDSGIYEILTDVLNYFRAGRVYICEYDRDLFALSCTYEVLEEGVQPIKDELQQIPMDSLPWWNGHILAKKTIRVDDVTKMSEISDSEYRILLLQDVRALIAVPLIAGDKVLGCLGVDMVDHVNSWTDGNDQWLNSLANIISICLDLHYTRELATRKSLFVNNLFRYMPLGYVRLSVQRDTNNVPYDFMLIEANQILSGLVGVSTDAFLGKTASSLHLLTGKLSRILELDEGECQMFEEYYERTGKTCRVILYATGPDDVVALFLDLTEVLKAYTALDHSEKLFNGLFSNMPVGVEIYDTAGKLIDVNSKNLEIFGVRNKTDMIGISLFDNPNFPSYVLNQIKYKEVIDFRLNYSFNDINGYYRSEKQGFINLFSKLCKMYDSSHNLIGYVLLNIDNTEKMDRMQRISDFENFFSLISDYAKVGYAKINLLSRKGYAIKQWFKNLGEDEKMQLDDVLEVYDKVHPEDRLCLLDFLEKVKTGEAKTYQAEMRVLSFDEENEWNWVRTNILVSRYEPEKGDIEVISINYDITELKRTEAQLIKARDKAQMADRLKSAFLANMSHEIRTPLNAIVGFSDLLLNTDDVEMKQEFQRIIRVNNDLLLQLISDILDLSKIEAGTLDFVYDKVDVNMLCKEVMDITRYRLKPGVEMYFEPAFQEYEMVSENNRLRQVLSNFLTNAAKFTEQGEIRVGYEFPDENHIRFYVSDTGIGISEEQCPKVFDRFVKLNTYEQGTGLGLSICKSIVEQLGGSIGVDSVLGKGSTFWFVLPLKRKE